MQRPSLQLSADAPASMQRRIWPARDERDLEVALEYLVHEGSIAGDTWRLEPLVTLAESGHLALTATGRLRIEEDDV